MIEDKREGLVGASGFQPLTSWIPTRRSQPLFELYPNLSQHVNLPAQIIHSLPTAVEDLVNC